MRIILSALALTLVTNAAAAARSSTITGSVKDSSGNPISNATVLVYSAGVRTGYSIFCPTCYIDCGKRASTDESGGFTIPDLADDLVFNLLAIKQGYAPKWIRHVDPLKGAAGPAVMKSRNPISDPSRVLRGRIVDARGTLVRDALVEGEVVTTRGPGGQVGREFNPPGWTDRLAVSNEDGEFEIAYGTAAVNMSALVSPRGMAPRLITATTGLDRKAITVTDGATVHGRLMEGGKPVPNVEFALKTIRLEEGAGYPEVRAATDAKGRFAITNVPPRRVWNLYATWESLGGRGAVEPMQCATEADGQDVDVGDIPLKHGLVLSGRVVLSDGKPIPEGMTLLVALDRETHTEVVPLLTDGHFELRGLVRGAYSLEPAVRGYQVPEGVFLDVLVKHNVSDYVVRLEPTSAAPEQ
jgi:hypothetical protein